MIITAQEQYVQGRVSSIGPFSYNMEMSLLQPWEDPMLLIK